MKGGEVLAQKRRIEKLSPSSRIMQRSARGGRPFHRSFDPRFAICPPAEDFSEDGTFTSSACGATTHWNLQVR